MAFNGKSVTADASGIGLNSNYKHLDCSEDQSKKSSQIHDGTSSSNCDSDRKIAPYRVHPFRKLFCCFGSNNSFVSHTDTSQKKKNFIKMPKLQNNYSFEKLDFESTHAFLGKTELNDTQEQDFDDKNEIHASEQSSINDVRSFKDDSEKLNFIQTSSETDTVETKKDKKHNPHKSEMLKVRKIKSADSDLTVKKFLLRPFSIFTCTQYKTNLEDGTESRKLQEASGSVSNRKSGEFGDCGLTAFCRNPSESGVQLESLYSSNFDHDSGKVSTSEISRSKTEPHSSPKVPIAKMDSLETTSVSSFESDEIQPCNVVVESCDLQFSSDVILSEISESYQSNNLPCTDGSFQNVVAEESQNCLLSLSEQKLGGDFLYEDNDPNQAISDLNFDEVEGRLTSDGINNNAGNESRMCDENQMSISQEESNSKRNSAFLNNNNNNSDVVFIDSSTYTSLVQEMATYRTMLTQLQNLIIFESNLQGLENLSSSSSKDIYETCLQQAVVEKLMKENEDIHQKVNSLEVTILEQNETIQHLQMRLNRLKEDWDQGITLGGNLQQGSHFYSHLGNNPYPQIFVFGEKFAHDNIAANFNINYR